MKKPILVALCFAVCIMIPAAPSGAGWGYLTGDEPRIWGPPEADGGAIPAARCSVIIARVRDVKEFDGDRSLGTHQATLEPSLTLAGYCDPSAEVVLHVKFYCGTIATSIHAVPPTGAMVLAVMSNKDYVVSQACKFMPDESALVVIDGLNDARVMDTILKLRKARHPDDADLTKPTTAPAGDKNGERKKAKGVTRSFHAL
jgi:hypothetical protein